VKSATFKIDSNRSEIKNDDSLTDSTVIKGNLSHQNFEDDEKTMLSKSLGNLDELKIIDEL
jgi:hypothetical protein